MIPKALPSQTQYCIHSHVICTELLYYANTLKDGCVKIHVCHSHILIYKYLETTSTSPSNFFMSCAGSCNKLHWLTNNFLHAHYDHKHMLNIQQKNIRQMPTQFEQTASEEVGRNMPTSYLRVQCHE